MSLPFRRTAPVLAVALLVGRAAGAQTCPQACGQYVATGILGVNAAARLAIDGGSTVQTTLTAPRTADFGANGSGTQIVSAGPTISVLSNTAYTVTASAPTSFTPTPPNTGTKLSSDVTIAVTPTINGTVGARGPYAAIGAIATNQSVTNGSSYALSYGTRYNWKTDKPGTYQLVVTFTLTSP